MNEYLTKPFSPALLRQAISAVFSDKDSLEEWIDDVFLKEYYDDDLSFQIDIFKNFLEQLDKQFFNLNNYLKLEDYKRLHLSAHALKSNFKLVGLVKHAEMSFQVEQLSKIKSNETKKYLFILFQEKSRIERLINKKLTILKDEL